MKPPAPTLRVCQTKLVGIGVELGFGVGLAVVVGVGLGVGLGVGVGGIGPDEELDPLDDPTSDTGSIDF
jgi:hypothetical protein